MIYSILNKNKRKIQWSFLSLFIILSIVELVCTIVFIWEEDVFDDPIDANIYLIDPRLDYKVFFVLFIVDAGICLGYVGYWIFYTWQKTNHSLSASLSNKKSKLKSKISGTIKMMSHECSENPNSPSKTQTKCSFATYNNRIHIFYRTPIMLLISILFVFLYTDRIDDFEQDLSLPLSVFLCSELIIMFILFVACISTQLPSFRIIKRHK